MKKKAFFLVSQVLNTKQTSKIVADTTFKRQPHKMAKHSQTIHHPRVMERRGWPIFQKVCIGGSKVKLGFWVRISALGRGDFFQVELEIYLHKK